MDFTTTLVEIWTLYFVGTVMMAARVFVRTKMVGVRGYSPDDYLVWFAWLVYTNVMVMAHVFMIVGQGKHTSLLTPEMRESMPVAEYGSWEFSSQIFLAGFFSYAIIVWTLKFNMLFFYRRLVRGTKMERAILPVLGLVGASAVAIILTFTLMCIPFRKLWQVYPDPQGNCVPQNGTIFYTVLVLNLITDLCIIIIPIPVVLPMQTSVARKIGLSALFGLGLFCMIAAIVRIILIFNLNQQGAAAMWSIREDFVAVFVGQAPIVYTITKPKFWKSVYGSGTDTANTTGQKDEGHQMNGLSGKKAKDPYSVTQIGLTIIDKSESQEQIIVHDDDSSSGPKGHDADGILVKRTYDVESSRSRSDHDSEKCQDQAPGRVLYRDDST